MKTINISEETFEAIKDQIKELEGEVKEVTGLEDLVGEKLFIRTVTYHWVGRVKKLIGNFVELEDASCVFSSGDLGEAFKNGKLDETEYVGRHFVNLQAVSDFTPWNHKLPN